MEGLARKRKVRAAHRGSVTRIVGQVYESLECEEALNLPKLRQQKLLLAEKLNVLSKLDDELIEMVGEDELDSEVEQADVIKEKIRVCIMDIEQAFERSSISRTTPVDGSASHRASLTESAASSHARSDEPPTSHPPSSLTPPDDLTDPVSIPPPMSGGATPLSDAPHIKLPKFSIKKSG